MADSQIAVFSATGGVQFRLGDDVNWRWWAGGVFQSRSPGLVEGKNPCEYKSYRRSFSPDRRD
ncbi:unknown protein (plasmid) [Synechocystis sp. PCC 6803]|uniref:Uncharacterized protein n=1 Tax=Synechocystis sp. (strain ATCC 27184 / PCC 6803 / Kazusa) TaxID=1111708 RepID=Q6ZEH6_SYNY3|nr:hypothetical protein MYO_4200 [Synechocystis sp. PCC 6803]BAD01924.1 unknown protein [Synechocystis sp. PCC 6803]